MKLTILFVLIFCAGWTPVSFAQYDEAIKTELNDLLKRSETQKQAVLSMNSKLTSFDNNTNLAKAPLLSLFLTKASEHFFQLEKVRLKLNAQEVKSYTYRDTEREALKKRTAHLFFETTQLLETAQPKTRTMITIFFEGTGADGTQTKRAISQNIESNKLDQAFELRITDSEHLKAPVFEIIPVEHREEMLLNSIEYQAAQHLYFEALTRFEQLENNKNTAALAPAGQLLKGKLLSAFGLVEAAQPVLGTIAESNASKKIKDEALFQLASIQYSSGANERARRTLEHIEKPVSQGIQLAAYDLAIKLKSDTFFDAETLLDQIKPYRNQPVYPYILINFGISRYHKRDLASALAFLQQVSKHKSLLEDHKALEDRARHAMAKILFEQKKPEAAWDTLQDIRTQGLYSNRSLITYAQIAMLLDRHAEAVAALRTLSRKSITNPEVQQAQLLLAQVYEQLGLKEQAQHAYLKGITAMSKGLEQVNAAQDLIKETQAAQELVAIFEKRFVEQQLWSLSILSPFLTELATDKTFSQAVALLGDLYTLQEPISRINQDNHVKKSEKRKTSIKQAILEQKILIQRTEVLVKTLVSRELKALETRLDYFLGQAQLAQARLMDEGIGSIREAQDAQ